MKTYILTVDDAQDEVIKVLAKALKIDVQELTEEKENESLLMAMEEGKKYGRLSDDEAKSFLEGLGK